jgi:hypothetical protein
MKKNKGLNFTYLIILSIIFFSCSKKVIFYCESSFYDINTTIDVDGVGKSKYNNSIVKDSVLKANYSIGLSFYSPIYKIKGKKIKISLSAFQPSLGTDIDTVFFFELTNKTNKVVFDFNYNFRDSTSFVSIKRLEENVFFR